MSLMEGTFVEFVRTFYSLHWSGKVYKLARLDFFIEIRNHLYPSLRLGIIIEIRKGRYFASSLETSCAIRLKTSKKFANQGFIKILQQFGI